MPIIPNLSFADYCKLPGLNASKLKAMRRSPAHAQLHREDTPSLRMGRALHTMVLEGDKFASQYCWDSPINPKTNKPFGSDTQKFSDWAAGLDGKEAISREEHAECLLMFNGLMEHHTADQMFACLTDVEQTITWDVGVLIRGNVRIVSCKARLDGVLRDGSVIDLKTTRDASPQGFAYAVKDYGYHIQEAWYRRGCKAHGKEPKNFYFIAVESEEPYGVGVYTLAPEWVMAADRIIDDLLPIYAECEKTGVWPAYSQEVQEISCPAHIAGVLEAKI